MDVDFACKFNKMLARTTEGRTMRCGVTSSHRSLASFEILKRCWPSWLTRV